MLLIIFPLYFLKTCPLDMKNETVKSAFWIIANAFVAIYIIAFNFWI